LLRRLHALRVDFKACFWITRYEPAAPATTIRPTRAVAVPLASFHFSRKARSNPAATHASAIGQSGKEVAAVRKPRGVSQSTGPCVSPAHREKARPAAPASAVAIPIRLSDLKTRMTSRSHHGALHTNAMETTMLSMKQPHKKRRGLARLTSARKFFTFISSAKGRIQSAERAVPTFSSTIRRIFFPA